MSVSYQKLAHIASSMHIIGQNIVNVYQRWEHERFPI